MSRQLTEEDGRLSLGEHAANKGAEIRAKYGPDIGWTELGRLLLDRSVVRYPCEIVFDASQLIAGEFAHPVEKGGKAEDGFTIYVHPLFKEQLDRVPYLVLYQLVLINYGPFASAEDAETLGANALGISKEDYYQALCAMADAVDGNGVANRMP